MHRLVPSVLWPLRRPPPLDCERKRLPSTSAATDWDCESPLSVAEQLLTTQRRLPVVHIVHDQPGRSELGHQGHLRLGGSPRPDHHYPLFLLPRGAPTPRSSRWRKADDLDLRPNLLGARRAVRAPNPRLEVQGDRYLSRQERQQNRQVMNACITLLARGRMRASGESALGGISFGGWALAVGYRAWGVDVGWCV